MITIPITINAGRPCERIALGRRGENEATQIVFDVSWLIDTFGAGTAQLAVLRPEDDAPYPAVTEQDDDKRTVTWTPTNADTANAGRGECELFWYVGDVLAKSVVFRTEVMRDIGDVGEEVPEAYETWVEQVLAAGMSAEEAVKHYPYIEDGTWRRWNDGAWVDTGVEATGPQGATGAAGADAVTYVLEPSVNAIVYDPNAEEGARLTPSELTLTAYQIVNGVRSAFGADYIYMSYENADTQASWAEAKGAGAIEKVYTLTHQIPSYTTPGAEIMCDMRKGSTVVARVSVPIVSSGVDAQGSDDLIVVSDDQPTSENNVLWVKGSGTTVQVPTYAEHQAVADEVDDLKSAVNDLTDQIGSVENENLFTEWENYLVSVANGTLYANPSYIAMKKAIPVKPGDIIYFYQLPTNRGTMSVVFYEDITEIGGTIHSSVSYNSNIVPTFECTVPQGANYFRVTIGFTAPTTASTVEDSVIFVNYHTTIEDEQNPALNVLVFGDSISDTQTITIDSTTNLTTSYKETYPNNWYIKDGITTYYQMWPSLIKRALNIKELRNYAKSGAHFYTASADTDPRQKLLYQVQVAINDLTNPNDVFPSSNFNPDIVIVACGVNDGSIPSGAFDATMAKTVMKAGNVGVDVEATMAAMDQSNPMDSMRYVLMLLKQTFPTALFLYVNPLQEVYDTNANRLTAREELRKMAEQYDFTNLDGFGQFGVVRDFETMDQVGLLTKDGLHPNDKGQNLYARNITQAIKRYYLPIDKFNP